MTTKVYKNIKIVLIDISYANDLKQNFHLIVKTISFRVRL